MKKINVLFIAALAIISAGLSYSFNDTASFAKTVVDDQKNVIDIPDKYFTNLPSDQLVQSQKVFCQKMQYYFNHPDEKITDPDVLHEAGVDTMNKAVESVFLAKEGTRTHESIMNNFKSNYADPMDRALLLVKGGLNTEGVELESEEISNILEPSDITVYNATGKQNITRAIRYSMNDWGKSPVFNFRLVNNPKDARIIVGELGPEESTEKDIQGSFKVLSSYYKVEIQGKISLSPSITDLKWNDPVLLHTLMHEMGHSLGRPDLYY